MLYYDFTVNEKTYKLKLTTRNVVSLEKMIGCSPLGIFGDGDKMPTVTDMVAVLFTSLQQYQHGLSLNDAYDIFDSYLSDNHTIADFLTVILEVYRVSGIIREDAEDTEKNA